MSFRHAILHREFDVEVETRVATAAEMRKLLAPGNGIERRLFTVDELARIGRASLLTKALAQIPKLKTQN